MLDDQEYKCAICGDEFQYTGIRTTANVDHCHKTGRVRGLLCENCNKAFGLVRESIETLEAMIAYKVKHG
ncbi:endonuclease domain-containing protein [Kitasatospora sp. NPDC008050]|uniref:endonuclease domain-containing protein n=1 Tax=Kitasatospora sp. NPDC008050 TaxID=3364021 RepID=UPI0036EE097D